MLTSCPTYHLIPRMLGKTKVTYARGVIVVRKGSRLLFGQCSFDEEFSSLLLLSLLLQKNFIQDVNMEKAMLSLCID